MEVRADYVVIFLYECIHTYYCEITILESTRPQLNFRISTTINKIRSADKLFLFTVCSAITIRIWYLWKQILCQLDRSNILVVTPLY